MKPIDLTTLKGAIFSDDGQYRYALWRVWSHTRLPLMFIGLNPSTANGIMDDPTITRLMVRSDQAGFGGLLAGNLYALVSSNPEVLLKGGDAVGPETDDYLRKMIAMSGVVLCAWGSFPAASKRASIVLEMVPVPLCLGVNEDGNPKHPLYISYHVPLSRYNRESK